MLTRDEQGGRRKSGQVRRVDPALAAICERIGNLEIETVDLVIKIGGIRRALGERRRNSDLAATSFLSRNVRLLPPNTS